MKELTYVNLSHNIFIGNIVVFHAAQKLEGLDLSHNMFRHFPEEYFDPDRFLRLEFVNVNFNEAEFLRVPEVCMRYQYCFKRTVLQSRDGNSWFTAPK